MDKLRFLCAVVVEVKDNGSDKCQVESLTREKRLVLVYMTLGKNNWALAVGTNQDGGSKGTAEDEQSASEAPQCYGAGDDMLYLRNKGEGF